MVGADLRRGEGSLPSSLPADTTTTKPDATAVKEKVPFGGPEPRATGRPGAVAKDLRPREPDASDKSGQGQDNRHDGPRPSRPLDGSR
ncbi:hypothetical protein GCM10023238_14970 [Streptomyces heliomycini]